MRLATLLLCSFFALINCNGATRWSSAEKLQSNICWSVVPPNSIVTFLSMQTRPGDAVCWFRFFECTNSLRCTNVSAITANFTNYTEIETTPTKLTIGKPVLLWDVSADRYQPGIVMGTNATGFHITNHNELINIDFAMTSGDGVFPLTEKFRQTFRDASIYPVNAANEWSTGSDGGAAVWQTGNYPGLIELVITNTATDITNMCLVVGGLYK